MTPSEMIDGVIEAARAQVLNRKTFHNEKTITDRRQSAIEAVEGLVEACEEFVLKVEAGTARSVRSYRQMKDALERLEKL